MACTSADSGVWSGPSSSMYRWEYSLRRDLHHARKCCDHYWQAIIAVACAVALHAEFEAHGMAQAGLQPCQRSARLLVLVGDGLDLPAGDLDRLCPHDFR